MDKKKKKNENFIGKFFGTKLRQENDDPLQYFSSESEGECIFLTVPPYSARKDFKGPASGYTKEGPVCDKLHSYVDHGNDKSQQLS